MESQPRTENAGTIQVDSKSYRLTRDPKTRVQTYALEFSNEPPWSGEVPNIVSEPGFTWHQGDFKSRQGLAGTREYGKNVDATNIFRLLPAAKITTYDLGAVGNTEQPTSIFEALGYIFVCAGRRVFRIDPATSAVTLSKDFGAGKVARMGIRWENDFGLVCTDDTTDSLWKVTAIGAPDTWTQTADVEAYRLAVGINRLFKVSYNGVLKNIPTGLDPMVEANWGDSVQIGEISTRPTGIVAYERTVFVAKPEGIFAVGEEGFGVPLIKRLVRSTATGRGMTVVDPHLYVPHAHGLYRWTPGLIETVGLETEWMNESLVQGPFSALISAGEWIYGFILVGTDVYCLKARERKSNEPGFGPLIWSSYLHFTPGTTFATEAIWFSPTTSPHKLFFGHGVNIGSINLPDTGGSPEVNHASYQFATAGEDYTARYKFDDWEDKDFSKIHAAGKNLDATNYWDIAYSLDGGAWLTLDLAGVNMRVQSAGHKEFILPITAVGREIQFRRSVVYDGAGAPPELSYFEPFAVVQPNKIPTWVVLLHLEANIRHDDGIDRRTALEQFTDLYTLLEQHTSVVASGPWGEAKTCWVRNLRIIESYQSESAMPSMMVQLALQQRES